ncbi:MAG TPA: fibronectin type III domain-containing protein [Solirubrobacterales bacterium]|nr:fibronectin type III domain-containing protein [Solirubrobacterales bacterium]
MHYLSLPSPGPLALSSTVKAEPVGNIRATLRAKINPEGKATEYHFEYVDDIAFQQNGFSSAKSTPTLSLGAEDFDLHAVEVQLGCTTSPAPDCLQPETTYHFRLIATNSEGKDEVAGEFITKPGLEVLETYATEVGTDAAQIHAEVNPLGIPTTGYFQYVDDATYQVGGFSNATRVPSASAFDFGAGETPLTRSARLDQLAPGTTYHYRLTAEDPLVGEVQGPERTFSTFAALNSGEGGPCPNEGFRTGPAAFLADCRGYEMVSPLDKNNSDIEAPNEFSTHLPAALNQSSLSGERLTYSTSRGFGDAGSAPYSAQYLASRDSGSGWHTHSIVPPRGAPALPGGLQTDTEFKSFSVDLCDAWLRTVADPVLAPGATAGFPNLYRRHDGECGSPGFEALTNAAPPHETRASTYPGLHYSSLELQGVSNDGSKAIYGVFENLTEDAPVQSQTCVNDLEFQSGSTGLECSYRLYAYDASDQSLHYVCVLPGGAPSAQPCSAGTASEPGGRARLNRTENAISDDGTRVFWSASTSTGMGPGKLYVRENPTAEQSEIEAGQCAEVAKACTIAVSKAAEALSGSNSSQYWTAAGDGSKAIFTTGSSLGGGEDLYSFDVDARTTQLIAHQVRGVMGAGGDASYVYFVSSEALDEGATAGKLNLYVAHAGASTYIATLVPGDSSSAHFFSPFEHEPRRLISRVSPDGRHVAFSSLGSLTGYDNADANNGQATAEVYLYDAAANEGAGSLVCASCNPSGGRPVGREVIFGPEKTGYWAAAKIPVWQNSLYAGRQLSDDGIRLYFTSTDALSARDTNGVQDVYQWEAPGSGSCTEAGPAYSVVNRGCVSLISSGKSIDSSEFVEVDPSGRNVFFITLSSLVPQDYGLGDIYDARVDGGFPPPQLPAATCEGEACQGPLSPPNDPTPGSSSFEGAGNVVEKPAKKRHKKHKKKLAKKHHKQTNRNGGKSR